MLLIDRFRGRAQGVVVAAAWAAAVFQIPRPPVQTVTLECNDDSPVVLRGTTTFDRPVQGPVQYQWKDENGLVLGTERELTLARRYPVSRFRLTLTGSAAGATASETQLQINVVDSTRPTVRAGVRSVRTTADASRTFNIFDAASFSAIDRCDPQPVLRAEPAGPYGPGNTQVRLSATDVSGNTAAVTVDLFVATPAPSPTGQAPAGATPVARGRGAQTTPPLPGARGRGDRGAGATSGAPASSQGAPASPPQRDAPTPGQTQAPSGPINTGAPGGVAPDGGAPGGGAPGRGVPDTAAREPASSGAGVQPAPGGPGVDTGVPASPSAPAETAAGNGAVATAGAQPAGQSSTAATPAEATGFFGSLWWLVGLVLLVLGLLALARQLRRPSPPTQASVVARAGADLGEHAIVLHDAADAAVRMEIRVRPRADVGEQGIDADDSVLIRTL